jgi:DNA-binding NarL/FixJ family response regulator
MQNVRIVVADDQLLIRIGIRALIETIPGYRIVAECADGQETIAAVRQHQPNILLLDIAMPGISGIEVARRIREFDCAVKILVVSSLERPEVVEQAIKAGANGYLLKDFMLEELIQSLEATASGKMYLSPRVNFSDKNSIAGNRQSSEPGLTPRQTEILRLVASGQTTKEIARELGISPKTVEFHRARLMERIGVRDVTGLTRYALQTGIVC